jgi:hypothetical protein
VRDEETGVFGMVSFLLKSWMQSARQVKRLKNGKYRLGGLIYAEFRAIVSDGTFQ